MKISIAITIVISLFMLAPSVQAQHAKKHYMRRTTTVSQSDTTGGVPVSSTGAEVSVTGGAPGDPYNLAHPYFQGDPRWSDASQLYMHGDFPWALVSQHPEDFRFNTSTGQWEISSTANLGKTK